jgi:hypothetical protein
MCPRRVSEKSSTSRSTRGKHKIHLATNYLYKDITFSVLFNDGFVTLRSNSC